MQERRNTRINGNFMSGAEQCLLRTWNEIIVGEHRKGGKLLGLLIRAQFCFSSAVKFPFCQLPAFCHASIGPQYNSNNNFMRINTL
jgi:hypothetical protein